MRDRPERTANKTAIDGARRRKASGKKRKPAKLSRLSKPEGMSLEDWQVELRRQFGREQDYRLKNVGDQPVFSEFEVVNPQSRNAYRVRVRGPHVGDNHCSCPDFATNTLGTCKHIEFVLAVLERKRGGPAALRAGFQPAYSEVFLQYGARREVRFRPGADWPPELVRIAERVFRIGRGALAGGVRLVRGVSGRGRPCGPRPALPRRRAGVRGRGARRRAPAQERGRGLPARPQERRLQGPPSRVALRLPARRGAVRRAGRALPDRRRNGPGQNHPGVRRRRDHGQTVRRRARADRLSHVAQAPVAARDRALHRAARRRSSAG